MGKPRASRLSDGFKEPKKFYEARNKQAQKLIYEPARDQLMMK
jgi:hypothetical protein